MSATTNSLLGKFIKIDQQIKRKEGEVDALKEQLIPIHNELMERFQSGGLASMKSSAGVTVYLRRELWAASADEDKAALVSALKHHDETRELVKESFNSQTLSSWVREKIKEHFGDGSEKKSPDELLGAMPPALAPFMKITEKFSLRSRKS